MTRAGYDWTPARAVSGTGSRLRRARQAAGRLEPPEGLRRGLGSPALFGIVQCFVAASVYFALGLVAERAQALTWLVFLAATLFFVLLVLTYMEGASLHQERGGATVIARHAFNELWSFIAGWAICLDYVILIAITAFATGDYAMIFWAPLGDGLPEFALATVIIAGIAVLNIRGGGPRRYDRIAFMVLADLVLQLMVVILGLALLLRPEMFTAPASLGAIPSVGDFLFASTLALVAFSGIDASSGLAGEVRIGRRGLRRLIAVRFAAATVPLIGIALVAGSALPLGELDRAGGLVERPMLGIAAAFEPAWFAEPLGYLIALSGMVILVAACNAAMLGLSRLGYSLALNRQIPSAIGRLHPRYATPSVVIVIGALLALVLLIPNDLHFLAGLYAFGATVTFTIVHLGVLVLRRREPARDRPFRVPLNVSWRGTEWPLPTVLGLVLSLVALAIVVVLHDAASVLGLAWMGVGITLYLVYRLSNDKPLLSRVSVPEERLTRRADPRAEYDSILVPVFGTRLDDDIVQTAGRLAAEEGRDKGEGGAVIEALWVFEVPLALPLDARLPSEELVRARRALARAKAVGEEYSGVEVATATVRARRAGEAIVREARRRGVEAIVLAAEEPTPIRGGAALGGQEGLHDTFLGATTSHVVSKAPCRVILTAPPAPAPEAGAPADGNGARPHRGLRSGLGAGRRMVRRPMRGGGPGRGDGRSGGGGSAPR